MTKHNAEAEEGAAPGGRTSRRRSLLRLAEYSRPGLILRLTRQEDVSCRDDRALTLPTLDPVDPGSGAYPFAIKRSCRDARVRVTRRRRELDSNLRFLARAVSVLPVRDRMFASSSLQPRVRVSQLREIQGPATGRWSFEAGLGARACLNDDARRRTRGRLLRGPRHRSGEQTTPGKFTAAT